MGEEERGPLGLGSQTWLHIFLLRYFFKTPVLGAEA